MLLNIDNKGIQLVNGKKVQDLGEAELMRMGYEVICSVRSSSQPLVLRSTINVQEESTTYTGDNIQLGDLIGTDEVVNSRDIVDRFHEKVNLY